MRLRGAYYLLAAALVASGTLLFSYASRLSFMGDEWQLLTERRDWDVHALLEPFNENLIAAIVLVYKLGVSVFGMESALPFYAVSIPLFLLSAALLFVYLERRVGSWPACLGAVLVLFLGAAHEDLFWAFQMGFFGSMASGLGALIALDREDRLGDRLACGLLLVSLAFGSVGLPFVVAAVADLARSRRPRRPRAYVALAPVAVYATWWVGWGSSAGDQATLESILQTPRYVFDAAASGLVSLLGREAIAEDGHPPLIAQALLLILIAGAVLRLARQKEISRGMAVALALGLSFWILIGFNRTTGDRFALSSRYQYPSAVFILIIAAELLRGARIPRLAVIALAVVTAGAVAGGIATMERNFPGWKGFSDEIRLNLSVLEIARANLDPQLTISFPPSVQSTAGAYFATVANSGSPAFDEAALLERSEADRRSADRMLAYALHIELARPRGAISHRGCLTIPAAPGGPSTQLRAGVFTLTNREESAATARLGRFANVASVGLGRIPPGGTRSLTIPADASSRSWRLATIDGPLRLCGERSTLSTHRVPRHASLPHRQP